MVKRRNSRKDETVVIKVLVMVKKKKKNKNKLGAKGVYAVRQGTHKQ